MGLHLRAYSSVRAMSLVGPSQPTRLSLLMSGSWGEAAAALGREIGCS
jgi:hypothetical protein